MDSNSSVYLIKITFNLNSQGNEKIEVFSQGIDGGQNLDSETLVIADYEYKKVFIIALLEIKLWAKENSILHDFSFI